jgi:hypothetical protein
MPDERFDFNSDDGTAITQLGPAGSIENDFEYAWFKDELKKYTSAVLAVVLSWIGRRSCCEYISRKGFGDALELITNR